MSVETSQGLAELVPDPGRADCHVLYIGGLPSSHVDLARPQRLHMDYLARLAIALDALRPDRGAPVDIVHVGGGALALPRYVAATRPRARNEVWEIEPELVALGRRRLGGRKLNLRCGDAADRIGAREHADVVVGDAFTATEIPPRLAGREFAQEVRRVLGPGGLYLLNVVDTPPFRTTNEQRRVLRDAFPSVLLFGAREVVRGRRAGNALFAASAAPLNRAALERALATGPFPGEVAG